MRSARVLAMVLGVLMWVGCQSTKTEGEPDTVRNGVGMSGWRPEAIRASLIAFLTERNYELVDSDRLNLDFDRPASQWLAMRHGSFVNPETFIRMRVFVVGVGSGDYWVGFEPLVVTERGSSFETAKPIKGAVRKEMQSLLEEWKAVELAP